MLLWYLYWIFVFAPFFPLTGGKNALFFVARAVLCVYLVSSFIALIERSYEISCKYEGFIRDFFFFSCAFLLWEMSCLLTKFYKWNRSTECCIGRTRFSILYYLLFDANVVWIKVQFVPMGWCRKEGQDTQDEVQRRNLRDELEDRERRHFSSKGQYIYKSKPMIYFTS